MQFSIISIVSLLAVGAVAIPAIPAEVARRTPTPFSFGDITSALGSLTGVQANGCSVVKCATALGPAVVGCAAAAAQEFVDPISDAACLAAGLNDGINPPAACNGCAP